MTRILAVIRIVIWILITCCAVLLMVYLATGSFSNFFSEGNFVNDTTAQVLKDETYSPEGITSVVIDGRSRSINVYLSQDGSIRVYETFRRIGFGSEPEPVDVSINGSELRISYEHSGWNLGISLYYEHTLDVYLPAEHWETFTGTITSGSLKLGDISADTLGLTCNSGSIKFDQATATAANLSCTSGSIKGSLSCDGAKIKTNSGSVSIESLEAGSVTADCTSGSIKIAALTATSFVGETTSGSIKVVSGTAEKVSSSVTSGSIKISLENTPSEMALRANSGSITCTLARDSSFGVSYKCSSGSIKSEFGHRFSDSSGTTGAASPVYTATVSSGSIKFLSN